MAQRRESKSPFQPSRNLPPPSNHHVAQLVPLAPNAELKKKEEISKRKQPKSRNGCVTCKARRMKCDETKPTCQQCIRRGVDCGGYPKFLRWRPVEGTQDGPAQQGRMETAEPLTQLAQGQESLEAETLKENAPPRRRGPSEELRRYPNAPQGLPSVDDPEYPGSPQDATGSPDGVATADGMFDMDPVAFGEHAHITNSLPEDIFTTTSQTDAPHAAIEANAASFQFLQLSEQTSYPDLTTIQSHEDLDWEVYHDEGLFQSTDALQEDMLDEIIWQPTGSDANGEVDIPVHPLLYSTSPDGNPIQDIRLYFQPHSPGSGPETIRHLFENQTCRILTIKDDHARNPWKTFVWPLAAGCPSLYHALAAMTYLHLGKTQPQLRVVGIRHFDLSMRNLVDMGNKTDTLLEAVIATRIALGFAESWDYQKSSTGIDHVDAAKVLIRKAASKHETSRLADGALSRLGFLANTCLYMDVLARLTCPDSKTSIDHEFMAACDTLSGPVPFDQQLDPLMGCAITLFPLIGRLADLVGRVRRRSERCNSPSIISAATELREAIERWHPLVDRENHPSSSSILDSIQLAEAYRWASLLLIRQAVPEIPWRHSCWELAQKTLVFLATVPLTSRTTIVQIFPLMSAGCDAFDVDDREWVRERWQSMSKRMVTGIVDRCKEVTIETWRRRDDYQARHGVDASGHKSTQTKSPSPVQVADTEGRAGIESSNASQDGAETAGRLGVENSRSTISDFPDSAAFKKGIDPLTRAGSIDYTVRGALHWLVVMKDWGWEVMLG